MATLRERTVRARSGHHRLDPDEENGLQISSTGIKPARAPSPKQVVEKTAPESENDRASNGLNGRGNGNGHSQEASKEHARGVATGLLSHEATNSIREPDVVLIHVCDEQRKENRDFRCRKDLLVSQMKYFASFLEGTSSTDDIDISVHCDLKIFEWLMKHIHRPDIASGPALTINNVVSILISSDFLQMAELVDACCEYICQHLSEIIKLPIDLNCIGPHLVSKLGDLLSDDDLDKVRDRRDKLVSKLYMKKLESLFEKLDDTLHCCAHCHKLFTAGASKWLICNKTKIFIDFHGNVVAEHVPDRAWDLNAFLVSLRTKKMSWREIYWHLWGLVHHLPCSTCGTRFPVSELNHCTYHSLSPIFTPGESAGYYPCCDGPALRFDTSVRKSGCCARQHAVQVDTRDRDIPGSDAAVYHAVLKREALVTVPFPGGGEQSLAEVTASETLEALRGSRETNANGGDKVSADVELALETYYEIASDEDLDEDEDAASSSDSSGVRGMTGSRFGRDDSAKSSSQFRAMNSRSRGANGGSGQGGGSSGRGRGGDGGGSGAGGKGGKGKKARRKKKVLTMEDIANDFSPKKRRTWRKDVQRDDDLRRMQVIIQQLESMRTSSKPKKVKGSGKPDEQSAGAANLASARRVTSFRSSNGARSGSRQSVRTGSARGTRS